MSRVIGILGPAYCGSTLLSMVLDGLPRVFATGEAYWFITDNNNRNYCQTCGIDCEIWSKGFRKHLKENYESFWQDIADRVDCDVIVSADKARSSFLKFGLPEAFIVPWRDPRAWVTSWLVHYRVNRAPEDLDISTIKADDKEIEKGLILLLPLYQRVFRWVKQIKIKTIWLDFEKFTRAPLEETMLLCDDLDLPFTSNALRFRDNKHHIISCNPIAIKQENPSKPRSYVESYYRQFGDEIKPDTRWKNVLTEEQSNRIINDKLVKEIQRRF